MENKKITKNEYFEMIKKIEEVKNNPELMMFIEHEQELLKRKSSKGGATKAQTENVKIAEMLIAELVKIAKPVTITDLMNTSDIVKNYTYKTKINGEEKDVKLSNQKISAILKQQVDAGKVVKVTDKKKSLFSVAD